MVNKNSSHDAGRFQCGTRSAECGIANDYGHFSARAGADAQVQGSMFEVQSRETEGGTGAEFEQNRLKTTFLLVGTMTNERQGGEAPSVQHPNSSETPNAKSQTV